MSKTTLAALFAQTQGAACRTDGPTEFSLYLLQCACEKGQATWQYVSWATHCALSPLCGWRGWEQPATANEALNTYIAPDGPRGRYAAAIMGHLYGMSDDDVLAFIAADAAADEADA